jgi:uncharacterized radical SAM superfamily Fe-S cluster-containing enzyme
MSTKQYEIIEFATEQGDKINVEVVSEQPEAFMPDSRERKEKKKASVTIEKAISLIAPIANGIVTAIDNIAKPPNGFDVTFKVALSGEFSIKLASLSSEANMEVKLSWKREERGD